MSLWYGPGHLEPGSDPLALIRDGRVAHLVLNRPHKLNAATLAMWQALPALVAQIEADPGIRLVTLQGAGGKAFCAGADIEEFPQVYRTHDSTAQYNDLVRTALLALERMTKPSLALIEGLCIGAGCGFALACDLRFATTGARFAIPPSKLGASYSIPDMRRLVATIGPAASKDLLYSSRTIDADEALRIGLVNRVLAPEELRTSAKAYADNLLSMAPNSIAASKVIINDASGVDPRDETELQAIFSATFASREFREGYNAFIEKRKPDFG